MLPFLWVLILVSQVFHHFPKLNDCVLYCILCEKYISDIYFLLAISGGLPCDPFILLFYY